MVNLKYGSGKLAVYLPEIKIWKYALSIFEVYLKLKYTPLL